MSSALDASDSASLLLPETSSPELSDTESLSDSPDSGTRRKSEEGKRRRVLQACESCRKKKTKCDGVRPECAHCKSHGLECLYAEKKKKRVVPKNVKYISGLEERVAQLENAIKAVLPDSANLDNPDVLAEELRSKIGGGTNLSRPYPCANRFEHDDSSEELSSRLNLLKISNSDKQNGTEIFISPGSFATVFSTQGLEWITARMGNDDVARLVITMMLFKKDDKTPAELMHKVNSEPIELPPQHITLKVCKSVTLSWPVIAIVISQEEIVDAIEKVYTSLSLYKNVNDCPLEYLLINCLLTIGAKGFEFCDETCTFYNKGVSMFDEFSDLERQIISIDRTANALRVLSVLPFMQPSLFAIQCIDVACKTFSVISHCPVQGRLFAIAANMAYQLGLHRRVIGLPEEVLSKRRLVWWSLFLHDVEVAYRHSMKVIINPFDMSVDMLKESDLLTVPQLKDDKLFIKLYRQIIEFTIISSRAHYVLAGPDIAKLSVNEIEDLVGTVDQKLNDWMQSIPAEIRDATVLLDPDATPEQKHSSLYVRIFYNNVISTIHHMSVHHFLWDESLVGVRQKKDTSGTLNSSSTSTDTSPLNSAASDTADSSSSFRTALNPRVYSSSAICAESARDTLKLFNMSNDQSLFWIVNTPYLGVAFLYMVINLIQYPTVSSSQSDLKVLEDAMRQMATLKRLIGVERPRAVWFTVLDGLYSSVSAYVRKCANENAQSRKRNMDTYNTDSVSRYNPYYEGPLQRANSSDLSTTVDADSASQSNFEITPPHIDDSWKALEFMDSSLDYIGQFEQIEASQPWLFPGSSHNFIGNERMLTQMTGIARGTSAFPAETPNIVDPMSAQDPLLNFSDDYINGFSGSPLLFTAGDTQKEGSTNLWDKILSTTPWGFSKGNL
ncbi:hypothetical protein CANCADRAFT_93063 [Tortispora caseinolytica NRRL Y-17796]|uniref:Zn(2)-C6 fungal-type domain-containing protein n=1 Tax=Tortispora caseinolytica NRRL Y-17796 TaxID=767744 RepID=A0A1E4TLX0_9ASCO|nr:hypothetical protein CANCADRAFT_93063 [Tortispora caseinolytica NRRL Y-17796]